MDSTQTVQGRPRTTRGLAGPGKAPQPLADSHLVYRILDDLKGRTGGFDDSWRTPVASIHPPGARAIRALFVAIPCRRALLLPRHTYCLYGELDVVQLCQRLAPNVPDGTILQHLSFFSALNYLKDFIFLQGKSTILSRRP